MPRLVSVMGDGKDTLLTLLYYAVPHLSQYTKSERYLSHYTKSETYLQGYKLYSELYNPTH